MLSSCFVPATHEIIMWMCFCFMPSTFESESLINASVHRTRSHNTILYDVRNELWVSKWNAWKINVAIYIFSFRNTISISILTYTWSSSLIIFIIFKNHICTPFMSDRQTGTLSAEPLDFHRFHVYNPWCRYLSDPFHLIRSPFSL